jgi:hypothetical protein
LETDFLVTAQAAGQGTQFGLEPSDANLSFQFLYSPLQILNHLDVPPEAVFDGVGKKIIRGRFGPVAGSGQRWREREFKKTAPEF